MNKTAAFIILALLVVVAVLSWLLLVKSAEAPSVETATTTAPTPSPSPVSGGSPAAPAPLHEKVTVTTPKMNSTVGKTFSIAGKAPGNWFFEASAPIVVSDPQGNKLGQSYIQAEGDWMTTSLVDFKGEMKLNSAYSGPATLVLMKDNPSGLPEHDDSLEIQIVIE